ncbi:restriction endonuclease subunit S [Nitrosomonas sp.]|uniref:restriction endonuclease subunit S n=1 Tax=Nitrosomonas sp. TaxID=42353 RepID=UPI0025EE6321|nr:restriction endonuclease subunit S [Nitrosomonas sp.]
MNGADLLASLPDGWRRVPLKTTCDFAVSNVDKHSFDDELPVRLCNYTDVYKNDRVSPDMDLMAATATPQEIERFRLEIGDVVITKDSESWNDIAIPAYIEGTADDFICGYHLAFIRPRKDVLDGRFLFRCMQSRPVALQLELEATGVTRYGLPKDAIGLAVLPLPPLPTQLRIANYLDREAARIDGLITEKERMLVLLEEKRTALISRLVTRGLDPNAPLKPSGQEWLGEIPAHWAIQPIKYLAVVGNGSTPSVENADYWDDEGYPWLNSSVVNVSPVTDASRFVTETALRECHLPKIQPPAVLVGITGQGKTRGMAAVLGIEATINQHIAFIKPRSQELDTEYLCFLLGHAYAFLRSDSDGAGSTKGAITCEQLANMKIPVPPSGEQIDICTRIRQSLDVSKPLRAQIQCSLDLLTERRSALITAAVTGQIPLEEMTG